MILGCFSVIGQLCGQVTGSRGWWNFTVGTVLMKALLFVLLKQSSLYEREMTNNDLGLTMLIALAVIFLSV